MILLCIGFMNAKQIMDIFMNILSILLPFIVGFIVAYAINPFVCFLEKKHIPRSAAVVIVVFSLLLLLGFLIFSLLPILYHQIVDFTIQLIQLVNHFSKKFALPSGNLEVFYYTFF